MLCELALAVLLNCLHMSDLARGVLRSLANCIFCQVHFQGMYHALHQDQDLRPICHGDVGYRLPMALQKPHMSIRTVI